MINPLEDTKWKREQRLLLRQKIYIARDCHAEYFDPGQVETKKETI